MSSKRVLSVGQCGADHTGISWTIRQHFEAEVVPADTMEDVFAELRNDDFALVLVNRVLDADGSLGLDVIRRMKAEEEFRNIPVMLVSNLEDAQHEAETAGALPGFGKSSLGQPAMTDRLKSLLQ